MEKREKEELRTYLMGMLPAACHHTDVHAVTFYLLHQPLHTLHLMGWRTSGKIGRLDTVHVLCLFVGNVASPLLTGFHTNGLNASHTFIQVGFAFVHLNTAIFHCLVPV